MHCEQAAVQNEKYIFAFAIDGSNAAALDLASNMRSGLGLCGDGVKDVNATDSPILDQGTERSNDGFDLREFRHERRKGSRTGIERECVFPRVRLGSIAERREDGFAFIPVGKLIGVMAAAWLSGLSRGDEQNGFIPVSRVADKAHRGAVGMGGGANAVDGSRLGLVRDAEESLQQAFVPKRMEHVQGVKALPRPILNAIALALIGQIGYGKVRSRGE